MKKFLNKNIIITAIVVILTFLLMFALEDTWVNMLTMALIMALFAVSVNIQVGFGGMMPHGHAMFLGIGAYSFTLLSLAHVPMILAILLGVIITAIAGLFIGYLCLKGTGMTFAFLNMGFNILLYTAVMKWSAVGSDVGLAGAPRPGFASSTVGFGVFILVIVGACILLLFRIMESPFARVIKGLRENEERLVFLGINTKKFQLMIFVISSIFAGFAGILYAMLIGGAYPSFLSMTMSTQGLMMCLIGGMSTFVGPILGAGIVTAIITQLSNLTIFWQGVLGIIIIVCVLGFRGGILGTRRSKKTKKTQAVKPEGEIQS